MEKQLEHLYRASVEQVAALNKRQQLIKVELDIIAAQLKSEEYKRNALSSVLCYCCGYKPSPVSSEIVPPEKYAVDMMELQKTDAGRRHLQAIYGPDYPGK